MANQFHLKSPDLLLGLLPHPNFTTSYSTGHTLLILEKEGDTTNSLFFNHYHIKEENLRLPPVKNSSSQLSASEIWVKSIAPG